MRSGFGRTAAIMLAAAVLLAGGALGESTEIILPDGQHRLTLPEGMEYQEPAEDEKDLSKVHLDLDLYRTFTRGFLEACPSLTEEEVNLVMKTWERPETKSDWGGVKPNTKIHDLAGDDMVEMLCGGGVFI
jgi:hypothetical protein